MWSYESRKYDIKKTGIHQFYRVLVVKMRQKELPRCICTEWLVITDSHYCFFRVDLEQTVIDIENNCTKNSTNYQNAVHDKNYTFMLYGILTVLRCLLGLAKYYALLFFCQRASVNLHKKMTLGLIGATMAFYDNHYIGNILNRFSYDLHNIDENLPFNFPSLTGVS